MIALTPLAIPPRRSGKDLVLRTDLAKGSDRKQFVSVPRYLYRGDRRWIPPPGAARRDALRPDRNPLLQDDGLAAFLVIAQNLGLGDETVGLIAAWTAASEPEDEAGVWGRWGLFDAINVEEVADRLFYEAENWLFTHAAGMAGIRGPCSLEPLVAPGLLTDGFDAQPLAFLPYNPPYYPEMVESQGYEPGPTWRVYSLPLPRTTGKSPLATPVSDETWARLARTYNDAETGSPAALVPRLVDWLSCLGGAEGIKFDRSWQRVADEAFRRAIAVVVENTGAGAAACFGIPDIGAALRLSRGRWFPLGWLLYEIGLRRARRLHLFPAAVPKDWEANRLTELYAAAIERAVDAGYQRVDLAPVPDDDERSLESLVALGAQPVQQFTIYEKTF